MSPASAQQGKAALVTGAASGIGRAVADRLASDGMDVLAVDLKPDPDGPGTPYQADLTDAAANEAAVNEALNRFGRLDVVVANAGIQHVSPIEDFPVDKWNHDRFAAAHEPIPPRQVLMARAQQPPAPAGSSRLPRSHGLVASPYKIAYVSAKHGVVGLCKTLALEGAGDGITANAVCPGYVRTPLVEKQIVDQAKAHNLPEEEVLEKVILQPHAVKELIEPSEVAASSHS